MSLSSPWKSFKEYALSWCDLEMGLAPGHTLWLNHCPSVSRKEAPWGPCAEALGLHCTSFLLLATIPQDTPSSIQKPSEFTDHLHTRRLPCEWT